MQIAKFSLGKESTMKTIPAKRLTLGKLSGRLAGSKVTTLQSRLRHPVYNAGAAKRK